MVKKFDSAREYGAEEVKDGVCHRCVSRHNRKTERRGEKRLAQEYTEVNAASYEEWKKKVMAKQTK